MERRSEFREQSYGEWRILLVCPKAELREVVFSALTRIGVRDVSQITDCPERYGIDSVLVGRQICLIDVSDDRLLALCLLEKIAAENVSVIALHSSRDAELEVQCLRRGACELLTTPIETDQLQAAIDRVAARRQYEARPSRRPGAVYAVMSGKGGAGSTTLATHLALCLADARPQKTLLVDADGITGSIAFSLQSKPTFSLLDVAHDLSRIDEDLWKNLVMHRGSLDLLLAPENPSPLRLPSHQFPRLLDFWRSSYDAVILDLPGAQDELSLGMVSHADLLLMISTCDLGSVYSTARKSAFLETCGVRPGVIKIVLNRFRPPLAHQPWDAVGGRPVFARVSDAGEALQKALLNGTPMPNRSKFGMDITLLARQLTGWPLIPIETNESRRGAIEHGKKLVSRILGSVRPKTPGVLSIEVSDQSS